MSEHQHNDGHLISLIGKKDDFVAVRALIDTFAHPTDVRLFSAVDEFTAHPAEPDVVCAIVFADDAGECARLLAFANVHAPSCTVLVLHTPATAHHAIALGQHGALETLAWPATADCLHRAVQLATARHGEVLDVTARLADVEAMLAALSPRQADVLELLLHGASSKAIAHRLDISKRTVDDHRRSLITKSRHDSIAALAHDVERAETLRERRRALTASRWPVDRPAVLPPPAPNGHVGDPFTVPPPLSEFGAELRRLEYVEGPAYLLDGELRLIWANRAWLQAGSDAGLPSMFDRSWAVGIRITDAMTEVLQPFYTQHLREVIARNDSWYHEYECPTPQLRRQCLMAATSAPESTLLVRHALISQGAHREPIVADEPEAKGLRQPRGVVLQCASCRRVQRAEDSRWVIVPAWIERVPTLCEQVLCDSCRTTHYQ